MPSDRPGRQHRSRRKAFVVAPLRPRTLPVTKVLTGLDLTTMASPIKSLSEGHLLESRDGFFGKHEKMRIASHHLSRRGFLIAGGAAAGAGAAAFALPGGVFDFGSAGASRGDVDLHLMAAAASVPLLGATKARTQVLSYNGHVPGPELRIRQGDRLRVSIENGLSEETTIHWHGVRVPNAMDGVPHLTQAPIKPGDTFVYDFIPPDAGTFWYHPHVRGFEQVARGLYAPLIVEERTPITVDRDITWLLDDWRLDGSAQITDDFGSRSDMMMNGRVGNTVTINGEIPRPLDVRSGERIRLRLINAANARIFALDFDKLGPAIIAIDGQPVTPHEASGPVVVAPGMRIDLVLDITGQPGSRLAIVDRFYKGLEYPLTEIVYSGLPLRTKPLSSPIELPANPLPEPDPRSAQRHDIRFGGGAMGMMGGSMGGGMMGGGHGMGWTVNGISSTGHTPEPVLQIPLGQSVILALNNDTAWWHPIHLHGHSFRVISRNGSPTRHREWQDTVLMAPRETAEIAFVADNPGDWMFHCHILEHQAGGMMATIRVG